LWWMERANASAGAFCCSAAKPFGAEEVVRLFCSARCPLPVSIRKVHVNQHAQVRRLVRRAAERTGGVGSSLGPALAAAGVFAAVGAALINIRQAQRAEKRHPPMGRLVEVDGVRVHVASWGDGAPVVLLHGNGTMVQDYVLSGLVERLLDDGHRVIAIDRPGYGHSDRPRDRVWDASAQADLVARTLARLDIERPVVVGHSWGAIVAAALAIQHESDLRGIVLLSGYYHPTRRADVWLMSGPAIPVVGDVMRYTISPPIGRLIAPKLIRKVFEPRQVPSRFRDSFLLDLALRPSQLRASAEDSALMVPSAMGMQQGYRRLRLPVAILAGDGDQIVTPGRQSARLHDEIPGSTLTLLPGLGHMIHYDAQDEIAGAVRQVLHRARGAASARRPAYSSGARAAEALSVSG
jgi:pimeloyl-ACP methyl ester carboxylesterase